MYASGFNVSLLGGCYTQLTPVNEHVLTLMTNDCDPSSSYRDWGHDMDGAS